MKENLELAFSLIVQVEGDKYTNDIKDPGGPTKYGVTLATAKKLGFDKDKDGDVDANDVMILTKEDAYLAFKKLYWDIIEADNLPNGNDILASDLAYNSGPGRVKELYDTNIYKFITNRWRYFLRLENRDRKGYFRGWCNRLDIIITTLEKQKMI